LARSRVGRETRERILEATRALLAEVGLEAVTLKAIEDRAGVGAGSFYNLFATKEEAVITVVRDAIAAVDPDHEGRGRVETVGDLIEAFLTFVTREPLARVYLQAAVSWGTRDPALNARFRRHQQRRVERVAAAIAREHPGVDDEEVRARAERLVSTLNGLAVSWMLDPSLDLWAHRDRLLKGVSEGR
jgi:AcrR family transcriptional regulator